MKKVLGLDLGTNSIGWAVVTVGEGNNEKSSILGCGSRVVPLSSDEKDAFDKGKSITTAADRRLKRSMRRNLQRRKLRRDNLKEVFLQEGWITSETVFSEEGKGSTLHTLQLRAKAVSEQVSLEDLAKVLLSISKKRGYKSSRKINETEDGQLVDGMEIAKELQKKRITPAEYVLRSVVSDKIPRFDCYRSDLEAELSRIWAYQQPFYSEILTDEFWNQLARQGKTGASKLFYAKFGITTADVKGKDRRRVALEWRVSALSKQLGKEELAYVISDLRGEISNSSGYLGDISDRSKALYFNNETVGQYLLRMLTTDPGFSAKGKVFYRQDYVDEFNRIWDTQKQFHPELTESLKRIVSERNLFYQRPLKSQKGLVSFCEFESHPIRVMVDGVCKVKTAGSRVAPRSSFLFQEFKCWQILNNLVILDRAQDLSRFLLQDERAVLFKELSIKSKMRQSDALKCIGLDPRRYEMNYQELSGNETLSAFYQKYLEIVNFSGHGEYDISKLSYAQVSDVVKEVLSHLGCHADIFTISSDVEPYDQQPLFKLWHLLYSYDGDNSKSGIDSLLEKIGSMTGLDRTYSKILSSISFKRDYASLSHKAIKKILPFLKAGYQYDKACTLAGYNHAGSMTAHEREQRPLLERIALLPMGTLRNPVVERIINQMINVVNAVADEFGKPDEIHIELARELKKNAKERERANADIQANNKRNEEIAKILQTEFHLVNVRKADILRYRLYDELKNNGYKTLYSDKYIPASSLFSKDIDIEHIIPQALMFDDSFANKTLEFKDINIEKGRRTANDFVKDKWGQDYYNEYRRRIDDLRNRGAISEKKRRYLIMPESEIPSGFVDRDLRNTQYISRKSRELLEDYVRIVLPTSGQVTDLLRDQWQLVDVMKELNFEKYDKVGKTYVLEEADGRRVKRIANWSKRNDHRHHAMDAITIAFTKREHIQILNNLNARSNKDETFMRMFDNETVRTDSKWIFTPPMPLGELRSEVSRNLESVLVSFKAKNKVVTKNVNKTKSASGTQNKTMLTPRGALHKEQVYGVRKQYETYFVPVGSKMTAEVIRTVASKREREALQARLDSFDGDAKKAFTGKNALEKNPLFIDVAQRRQVLDKVKCVRFKTVYTIRKSVAPDLTVDKVLDTKARTKIQERIALFGGNVRQALSNLEENPIWLDEAKTIPLKRVTIGENFSLCAIHNKRDKNGRLVFDNGFPVPNDYVNLRSNHHIALYTDADGKVQELVVPLFEALNRINAGLPVVDKRYRASEGWHFLFSMKINEMFVFPDPAAGFLPSEIDLMDPANADQISTHLFRVQKLSAGYYCFRHHLETELIDDSELRDITWKRINSPQHMSGVIKVRVNHLGRIVSIGEYD